VGFSEEIGHSVENTILQLCYSRLAGYLSGPCLSGSGGQACFG
jgi:hypothetical protein